MTPNSGVNHAAFASQHDVTPKSVDAQRNLSLCEALDRLLHKGVVLRGEIAISVADVELLYLGLQVLLASTDTARSYLTHAPNARTLAGDSS